MIYRHIPDPGNNQGYHSLVEIEDFEFVNPKKQIAEMLINAQIHFERDFLRFSNFPVDTLLGRQALMQRAVRDWNERYLHLKSVQIPFPLKTTLSCNSKKEQIKTLKGLAITSEQLLAFLLWAGDNGYLYNQYRGEHLPKGVDGTKIPTLAEVSGDGTVDIIGKTELTPGQIKQSIEQRHVAVSKFLDKGTDWHCFFLTYKSVSGEESYKGGQPHLHYISNAWGLTRAFVVEQLKSKNYKLPALPHIDFEKRPNDKN